MQGLIEFWKSYIWKNSKFKKLNFWWFKFKDGESIDPTYLLQKSVTYRDPL